MPHRGGADREGGGGGQGRGRGARQEEGLEEEVGQAKGEDDARVMGCKSAGIFFNKMLKKFVQKYDIVFIVMISRP